jgi:NAD(P)-dependent dehydrogenase (short-subunit alcohol dehydrogenase family)
MWPIRRVVPLDVDLSAGDGGPVTEAASFPTDRTAIVTGAASRRGIGRATADRLARDGWSIAILDVDGAGAAQAAAEVGEARGVRTLGLAVDIADERSVGEAVSNVEETLPPIVALANVAGVSSPVAFLDLTSAEWDRVFDVNLRGTFFVTRRVVPGMVERGVGRVVSVSSISAQRGGGTYSKVAYSAAKAGVIGFTRALAREMGPHGVTVNCIAPGPVDTDIMGGRLTDDRKREMTAGMPLGRVGTVQEVAALLAFLCGEDAGWITAATYDINGGLQVS